jgi:type II secretory pathway pseudopilin PulG
MPQRRDTPSKPLGLTSSAKGDTLKTIEVVAIALSLLWFALTIIFFLVLEPAGAFSEGGALRFVLVLMTIFLPVAMIWVVTFAIKSSKVFREESQRLQAAIDAIRHAYLAQAQAQTTTTEPSVAKKLDEIAAAQRKTESALAMFTSSRQPAPLRAAVVASDPEATSEDQVALPLGTPAEDIQPPLAHEDFIRALNFPETAEDKAGFAALRRALKDRTTAQLIQASQDVLTLLSQDGIYMDDLRPDMARPEIWRRFAAGERGRQIATLGGVRDRSSLALTATRMRSDPIFRDAAHHFLRKFDRMISEFAETASDGEISNLSDTRTARAFMLLGRVAGTFD